MKKYNAVLALLSGLALSSGAQAELYWQDFSLSYLNGKNYQAGDDHRQVLTVEHASGQSWGDTYFFMDRLRSSDGSNETYYELSPRLGIGAVTGNDLSFGPVKDIYIATTMEGGSAGNGFNNYLYGLGVSLDIPGFKYANVNIYKANNDSGVNDEQLTLTWGYPFSLGSAEFLYDGFLDWTSAGSGKASEMNFTSQLKYDLGKSLGLKSRLYVGMEYAYWSNKFGVAALDERNPALLVKYHF
ncbi:DUF5020 family protein [Neptunomonas antarctica]|uniref:Nucleoside-specific outer membrane channel protein Tsx n=1 Tax=Neptunomonas antarctica TaxID=619304 RepID=A0A1N7ISU7_9GAMM|nr:DUF5020 family protein [Neptunomonas antarctica]SIS40120.1 Nucleoside-specific outer membrane channel protein Tsx [Neptunomonas antarctica]